MKLSLLFVMKNIFFLNILTISRYWSEEMFRSRCERNILVTLGHFGF